MGIHDGHRSRMKKQFLDNGLDSFDDHKVLELLLFYALPRGDTNPTAHELINRFGSIAAVFDAPAEELARVPGLGDNAVSLIKLIPELGRRYAVTRTSMDNILDTTEKAGAFLIPHFYGEREETVYMVCLDGKRKVINCKMLGRGSVNSANVSIRKIVETALLYNATSVILAHNHTSGIALPSREDEYATLKAAEALRAVDVILTDHIIVAEDDFVSLADNGIIGACV